MMHGLVWTTTEIDYTGPDTVTVTTSARCACGETTIAREIVSRLQIDRVNNLDLLKATEDRLMQAVKTKLDEHVPGRRITPEYRPERCSTCHTLTATGCDRRDCAGRPMPEPPRTPRDHMRGVYGL